MNGKERYRQYLQSEDWKKKKDRVHNERKLCRVCGNNRNLDVHHLNYRDRWQNVKHRDLVLLCRRCHTVAHRLLDGGRITYFSERSHLRFEETKKAVLAELRWKGEKIYWPPKFVDTNLDRDAIRALTHCPNCGVKAGEMCRSARKGRPPRIKNHAERNQLAYTKKHPDHFDLEATIAEELSERLAGL